MHAKIYERYHTENIKSAHDMSARTTANEDLVIVIGGGRITVDADKKQILFDRSSGSYGKIANKVVYRATQELRKQGRTTDIAMD